MPSQFPIPSYHLMNNNTQGRSSHCIVIILKQVHIWRDNPYSWHETSDAINSTVLDIKIELIKKKTIQKNVISCSNGWNSTCNRPVNKTENLSTKSENTAATATSVTNLSHPIELYIPFVPQQKLPGMNNPIDILDPVVNFIALSSNKEHYFVYHKVDLPSPLSTVLVTLKPSLNVKFHVYIQYGFEPTQTNYTFNRTIPDFSSCHYSIDTGAYGNCTFDPFSLHFSWEDTGNTGTHYIGILYYGEHENATLDYTPSESKITKRNNPLVRIKRDLTSSGFQGGYALLRSKIPLTPCDRSRRGKRSCLEYKDPPLPRPLFELRRKVPEKVASVNYTIRMSSGTCMFWNEDQQTWDRTGCMVSTILVKLINPSN